MYVAILLFWSFCTTTQPPCNNIAITITGSTLKYLPKLVAKYRNSNKFTSIKLHDIFKFHILGQKYKAIRTISIGSGSETHYRIRSTLSLSPKSDFLLLKIAPILLVNQHKIEEVFDRECITHSSICGRQIYR